MSWHPMGIPPWPFSFTSLPEHVTFENDKTGETVEYAQRGTCKWEPADFITEGEWWNTSCGGSFTWEPDGTPDYCPNCGRRVEE